MQSYLNLPAATTDTPKKKWFEGEQRCDLFFLVPVVQARNRLLQAIPHQVTEKTGSGYSGSEWEGNFKNDYLQLKLTIFNGKGKYKYNCFGKLLGSEHGVIVQLIIRDTSTSGYIPAFSIPFFAGALITQSLSIIIVMFFFYGSIVALAAFIERQAGLHKAIEIITNLISV